SPDYGASRETARSTLPIAISPGGVAQRLIAPVLKFEFKILDRIGQVLPALSSSSMNSLFSSALIGPEWSRVPLIFSSGLLSWVTCPSDESRTRIFGRFAFPSTGARRIRVV